MGNENVAENKAKKAKKPKLWVIILLSIAAIIILTYVTLYIANGICAKNLIKYIRSFEPVGYEEDRLIPEKDENGFFTLKADRDVKIMQLTDIHLGGGLYTTKQDKKAIYELISMLQKEKPDLVILTGDNIFAVPGPIFNGGGTLNNLRVSKVILEIFEHEKVYFSTVFGNHDTEVFDYTDRQALAALYESDRYKYCIFEQNFTDSDAGMPSVTNQCILVKNASDEVTKALMLTDSNSYVDKSIKSVLNWDYDVIHDSQTDWAYDTLKALPEFRGETVKSLFFFHIPIGEFEEAYRELLANDFENTADTTYISGAWDEKIDEALGGRIWYGGCADTDTAPKDADLLFERLGPDGLNSMEACFCGHDHTNNGVVRYKGVLLSYSNSLDNIAYDDICKSGKQRGCTVITIDKDGNWTEEHKNVYEDYSVEKDKFYEVNVTDYYISDIVLPGKEKRK